MSKFSFPNVADTKYSDKNKEEYHKNFAQAIAFNSVNSVYSNNLLAMNECYDFYNGDQGSEELDFVQDAGDGSTLPAKWIDYNGIKTKIDLQIGELALSNFNISAKSVNQDAVSRKLQKKFDMRNEMKMLPYAKQLQESTGLPLVDPSANIPETEEDLEHWYGNYKEKAEIFIQRATKFITSKVNFETVRLHTFRDLLITGRSIIKVCYKNGEMIIERVDPREFIFDSNASDDFLSDSTYFGQVKYYPIAQAAQRYNLTNKEIMDVYNQQKDVNWLTNTPAGRAHQEFTKNVTLDMFQETSDGLRVLVVEAYWLDITPEKYIIKEDKYGGEHIKAIDPDAKKYSKALNRATWRKCSLIGGDLAKDWGLVEGQGVDVDNINYSYPPFIPLFPNYINGKTVSQVDQMKGIQMLKNISLYNLQSEMNKAGTKGFVYDVSQTPDGWSHEMVIKYLKTVGIAFIDSRKDGDPAQYNQFNPIDLSLGQNVEKYLAVAMMCDREMSSISGINEAREGVQQGATQAVGVTQSSLLQSNMMTAHRNRLFEIQCNKSLTQLSRLIKVYWKETSKYAHIIGDMYSDFINDEIWLDLDDYVIEITTDKTPQADMAMMQQLVMAALQAQAIGFDDALEFSVQKDIREVKRIIQRRLRERESQAQAAQQQQQAQQQQFELAAKQQQSQSENDRMLAQYMGQSNLTKVAADAKKEAMMEQQVLKNKGAKELETIKAMMKALEEKPKPKK